MKFLMPLFALTFTSSTLASGELTPADVERYLTGKNVIICEVEKEGDWSLQVQLFGAQSEWGVWFLEKGTITAFQRVLNATATPLEGMQFLTHFQFELERGTKLFLELNGSAEGHGTVLVNQKKYPLNNCRSQI